MAAKRQSGEGAYKRAAVQALAAAGTYFRDAAHLAETINDVYGDDRQGAGGALMAASSASMNAGRVDLGGASAGVKLGTLQSLYDGYMIDEETGQRVGFTADDLNARVHRDVINTQAASTISHPSMKDNYVEQNLIPEFRHRIEEAYATGDETVIARELATVANMYDTLAQTNPKMGNVFADQVMSLQVTPGGTSALPLAPGAAGVAAGARVLPAGR